MTRNRSVYHDKVDFCTIPVRYRLGKKKHRPPSSHNHPTPKTNFVMSNSSTQQQNDRGDSTDSKSDVNDNVKAFDALRRLLDVLKAELNDHQSAPVLSHYRHPPELVKAGYQMMKEGSQLVHSTSTKYTLVGNINVMEGSKIASDLRQGCELVATGAMMICCDDHLGMCRSARKYAKFGARSVVGATMQLIQVFVDESTEAQVTADADHDVGAQRTGVVWDACQKLQQLPQGNRNAMRRDLFQWTSECNESMEEFQQMINLGAFQLKEENGNDADAQINDTTWDDFCEGRDDERYSPLEMPIATACVAIIKCSRGCMNLTLQACDCAGSQVDERLLTVNREDSETNGDATSNQLHAEDMLWISKLHDLARAVGDGMTDFASLLYPPIEVSELRQEMNRQVESILQLLGHVLDAPSAVHHGISKDVIDLANRIKSVVSTRQDEALSSMEVASSSV